MAAPIDLDICREMASLIEKLTTTGKAQLDPDVLKKLKKHCRISDEYIRHVYHLINIQLEKEHAEIRLSTFLLVEELFNRSHCFRNLLLENFQSFLELTMETDPDFPLPPPHSAAKLLKKTALECIQKWKDKFGEAYKQLDLGYNFLKQCKKVDFADAQARSIVSRQQAETRQQRRAAFEQQRLQNVQTLMEEMKPEIETCLMQMENCFTLLLPDPDSFTLHYDTSSTSDPATSICSSSVDSSTLEYKDTKCAAITDDSGMTGSTNDNSLDQLSETNISTLDTSVAEPSSQNGADHISGNDDIKINTTELEQTHGLGSRKYQLSIEIPSDNVLIPETSDNTDILATLSDMHRLVGSKFLPTVIRWLDILGKSGGSQSMVKEAIDIKQALQAAEAKHNKLRINWLHKPATSKTDLDDGGDDSDFEEVPVKDGYESDIPEELKEENYNLASTSKQGKDPTSWKTNVDCLKSNLKEMYSSLIGGDSSTNTKNKKNELLQKAPVVPFDTDLINWGDRSGPPTVVRFDSLHRFWAPRENDDMVDKIAEASINTRMMHFTGDFQPVKWKCRAVLSNGELCQRMDRVKCPFHGKIIPRDDKGVPKNPEDAKQEKLPTDESKDDWDDPSIQNEIEAATGITLTRKGKGKGKGKGKAKQYPNLTDIKKVNNTAYTRLEKKVFNQKAIKRVSEALNVLDAKRHTDKFANNFSSLQSNAWGK